MEVMCLWAAQPRNSEPQANFSQNEGIYRHLVALIHRAMKTKTKMVDVNANVIALTINLNQIKRQELTDYVMKQNLKI